MLALNDLDLYLHLFIIHITKQSIAIIVIVATQLTVTWVWKAFMLLIFAIFYPFLRAITEWHASRVIAMACRASVRLSVRPSVCLLHPWSVSKWCKLGSRNLQL